MPPKPAQKYGDYFFNLSLKKEEEKTFKGHKNSHKNIPAARGRVIFIHSSIIYESVMKLDEAFKTLCVWARLYRGRTLLREWLGKPPPNDRHRGEISSKAGWDMGTWRTTIPGERPDPALCIS